MNDAQVLQLAKVLWAGLFASLFMYLVIAYQLGRAGVATGAIESNHPVALLLKIGAVVSFLLAFWLPRLLARVIMMKKRTVASGTNMSRNFPLFVLRLALFESVALFGLILGILTSSGQQLWPFLGISAFGFLMSFPSKSKLEAL